MSSNQHLHKNNFDFLRLFLALIVCLVHSSELTGYAELLSMKNFLSSKIAVESFFVISGFLIFMSYEKSSSIFSYATKRIRRIYPAYFFVILCSAFGLFAISSFNLNDYFQTSWLKYLIVNLSFLNFLQHELPGVFTDNKIQAVNGALWTLKIEIMFYISVPIIVYLFGKFNRLIVMLALYSLSILFATICTTLAEKTGSSTYSIIGRQLPGQLAFFIAGAFFYYYFEFFKRNVYAIALAASLILISDIYYQQQMLYPIALASIVIFFGFSIYLGNFGKFGDFSYGVYILHFPIIQTLIQLNLFSEKPWLFLLTVLAITTFASYAMWHVIEKRFLIRKSHYVYSSKE